MKPRLKQFSLQAMCRSLNVHRSGFYAWLHKPLSDRAREDERLFCKIKQFWSESGFVYGYRNITKDMKDDGELVGKNRVHRIMRAKGIQSHKGYKRHQGFKGGEVHQIAPNTLDRVFSVSAPNQFWVTDFTYIRTHQGWLYLMVVIDLFNRQVVGWSMKSNSRADLVIDALLMAVWRRQPKTRVLVHSDQGIQYTCGDWRSFLDQHNLQASMSRRGNCHDNAVAESFFANLKKERVKRRIYKTRSDARADVFDYIEMFYNPKRRHGSSGDVSPIEYEKQYVEKLASV